MDNRKKLLTSPLPIYILVLLLSLLLMGCQGGGSSGSGTTPGGGGGGGSTPAPTPVSADCTTVPTGTVSQTRNVTITWVSNDKSVQEPGGSFRVYVSKNSSDTPDTLPANVVSHDGTSTPTQITLPLDSGQHYVTIVAVSSFGGTTNVSTPSRRVVCIPYQS